MANIFDLDPKSREKPKKEPEKAPRSKKRLEPLTPEEFRAGKERMADMVDTAFAALQQAMTEGDHGTSIKAAQIILDRAGFGPKSTVDINTTTRDLSKLSREELAQRASTIAAKLREKKEAEIPSQVH